MADAPIKPIKMKEPPMSSGQFWRLAALGFVTLLSAVVFWWAFRSHIGIDYSLVNAPAIIGSLVVQIILFCFWIALVGVNGMASLHHRSAYIAVVPSTLAHFIFYGIGTYTALVFVLLNLALYFFTRGVLREVEERVHFSALNSVRAHLGLTMTIALLCVSLMFYLQTVVTTNSSVDQVDILGNSAAGIVSNVIAFQVKEYQPEMPLDEFILIGLRQLGDQFVPKEVETETALPVLENQTLSEELLMALERGELTREQIGDDIIAKAEQGVLTPADVVSSTESNFIQGQIVQIRTDLLKQFEVEASGQEPVISVLRRIMKKIIADNIGPYEPFIPPFLALALFFVLICFAWLFNAIVKVCAMFFVWLFHAAGIIDYEGRDVKQQLLILAHGKK